MVDLYSDDVTDAGPQYVPEAELEWMLDPRANYASMVRLGEVHSYLQLKLDLLESATDNMIAEVLDRLRPLPLTAEEKKIRAKGDKGVMEHKKKIARVRKAMLDSKIRYDAYRAGLDGMRTVAANQREELKRMPGMV